VSFFAAQNSPDYVEMPELVEGYDEQGTVSLDVNFTAAYQFAAIAFHFSGQQHLNYSVVVDATVSGGWTLTLSLEDSVSGSGCVYTTGSSLDYIDYADSCWGDFDGELLYPDQFYFDQINVRIESASSGAGSGTLTIDGLYVE
jgi:hypothetical protein